MMIFMGVPALSLLIWGLIPLGIILLIISGIFAYYRYKYYIRKGTRWQLYGHLWIPGVAIADYYTGVLEQMGY